MDDDRKTKAQLIVELNTLRRRVADLEAAHLHSAEREQMGEVLRKYQLLFDNARDIILFINHQDGRILEANHAAEQAYDYSRAELLTKSIYDLRAASTQPVIASQMNQADTEGIFFETVHRRRDGIEFPVEVNSRGATIGDERVLLSIIRDITERKRAEEEIQSLAQFPEGNPSPILRISREGVILYANRSSQGWLEAWNAQIGSRVPPAWYELISRVLEKGQFEEIEVGIGASTFSVIFTPFSESGYVNLYGRDITEHKRVEEELRKLSRAVEQSPATVLITDTTGNIEYVNPKFVEITGYSFDEAIGTNPRILKSGHTSPEEYKRLWDTIMSGGEWRGEFLNKKKSGELYWEAATISPILNEQGKITHFLAVKEDITERKQAEDALRESQADLNRAQAVAHTGSWRLDVRRNELLWSDETHRMFGIPKGASLTYEAFLAVIHPEDRDFVDRAWQAALRGEPYDIEHRILVGDTTKWVREQAELEFDPQGTLLGGFGTVQDITERKRAEAVLRRSEAVLTQAGQMAHLGAWEIEFSNYEDVNANPLRWSDEVYRIFGYDPGEVESTNALFFERVHPDDRQRIVDAVGQAMAEKRSYEIEHRVVRPDGTERIVLEHAEITFDQQGRPLQMIGAVQDITERKRAEEALRDLNTTLEHRVLERTTELQAAYERLTELDRLKDEFLSRISHELRTPLSNIKLYLELLERGKPEKHVHYLETLQREANRLQGLVMDLLKITELSAEAIELEVEAADLNRLIGKHLVAWGEMAARRGLEFQTDLAADLPPALIDRDLIVQVAAQLINNAIHFTSAGTITLSTAVRQHDNGAWVTLSVVDTGPGIASDELPRIFERFYRGRAAANYRTAGMGVGLSISQEIVMRLNGRITVESELGHGSTFTVWVPVAKDEPPLREGRW